MAEKWSVHSVMDAGDIARVMEWRETALNGRKYAEQDMIKDLREIAYRFLAVYRGNFSWLMTQQEKFGQYGKLFDSVLAGVLNSMVRAVEDELQQTVRAEKHREKKAARPGAMQQGQEKVSRAQEASGGAHVSSLPDGTFRLESADGYVYHGVVRDGRVTLTQGPQPEKRKDGIKLNMGARPVVGDLFSDEDMAGGQE